MSKQLLLTAFFTLFMLNISAQTTIGFEVEPREGAILDLKEFVSESDNVSSTKGVVLPRVELTTMTSLSPLATDNTANHKSHVGTVVYNLKENAAQKIYKGLNIWSGSRWELLCNEETEEKESVRYFYMPPFELLLGDYNISKSVNLYTEYSKYFKYSSSANPLYITSEGTSTTAHMYGSNELYYVVLDHSDDIAISSITASGVMTYRANTSIVSDKSYINILLVVKE